MWSKSYPVQRIPQPSGRTRTSQHQHSIGRSLILNTTASSQPATSSHMLRVKPLSRFSNINMKLSALLFAVIATAVVAESCTSKAPAPKPKPTSRSELCTRICASSPIQNCGKGWYSKQQGECWSCCKRT
ncbi:hypothetical protein BU25DRAFT_445622 [Macroventuria anomochaeta]|uniref:Uncharacterized protein n=1 Tax=Macroventuria anomochaeta TaxID=301207 RepID=A0ACB6SE13_9PLEO|nr:uncharacterized protein BU25DRAFT_445622 [Macroventuria anomochaeta]KAF2631494.1 hypothetical protein BU25DRAFT_445622 [Macroventuria anomochaeta]